MSKKGRPRAVTSRRKIEKFAVSNAESREIKEFSMLARMSKSEFIRTAIADKIRSLRDKFGLKESEEDYYYDDFEDFDDDVD